METIVIIALIIINIFTIYKFLFNLIFIDKDDFNKSVGYSLTPDIISLFRGEYWKDRGGEIKLGFFIMLCIIVTVFEYSIVIGIIKRF
ncbi:hypothetical protein KQI41_11555 [Tissierella pigra]|uniref:Uncharacterized protein n=1 Tax=Tissierella pigra TaxID=2607614 RepID=A0A6N7XQM2_9FIRM|nr:hypothetical protein [Tissierella pigra]MBU5427050.1 hypothetical protein [Tissierella pigra]MSU03112.1 hypothetical protein [Tissierella pigra]